MWFEKTRGFHLWLLRFPNTQALQLSNLGQSPQVSQHCKAWVQNWTLFRIILLTLCTTLSWLAGLQLLPALLVEHLKKKRQQHDKLPPEIAELPAFTACHNPDVAFKPPLAVSQIQKERINTALPLLIPGQEYIWSGWRHTGSTGDWEGGS